MKTKNLFLPILFSFLMLTGCSNDDDAPKNPVDQLPKATQTGANTAGCLVNGKAFLPKGGGLAGNKNCFYQYVDGGYHFGLQFSNSSNSDIGVRSVLLGTKNSIIEEGQTYILNSQPFFINNKNGRGGVFRYKKWNAKSIFNLPQCNRRNDHHQIGF